MKQDDSNFSILEYISMIEDQKSFNRTKSQNEILPRISDYINKNKSNSRLIKNLSTTNNSNNISTLNNHTLSKNVSCINLYKKQINHREFFPLTTKFQLHRKQNSYNIIPNNLYITENIDNKSQIENNTLNENKINIDDLTNLEKLKYIKFTPYEEKNKKINVMNKIPIFDYIKKTREYKLLEYNVKMKKERAKRIIETRKSEKKSIDEIIKSLHNIKKKFNNEYLYKYNFYIRDLERKVEKERENNQKLLQKIEDIQKEILLIESKIEKTQYEKDQKNRWFFLQIQVKEKLKDFPSSYKTNLNITKENNELDDDNKINKNNTIKPIPIIKFTDEELNIINKYEGKIIFENVEDFFNQFQKLSNLTLKKINSYQLISENLDIMRKNRNDIRNEMLEKEKDENNKMKKTTEKLKILKSLYLQNMKKKRELERQKNPKLKNLKRQFSVDRFKINNYNIKNKRNNTKISITTKGLLFHSLSSECLLGKNKENSYNTALYKKIYEIFRVVLNFGITIENLIKGQESLTTKIDDTIESKMLNMLEFIEIVLNLLIEKNHFYKRNKNYSKELKKIHLIIEKMKRNRNYLRQVQNMDMKNTNEIQNIQNKIDKKYYLPYRKVSEKYFLRKNFNDNNFIQNSNENKYLTFNDFMYD